MGDENPMSASTGAIKKKKDEKARRRDQRSWENVIRSVSNMSDSDKIAFIQEKYNEIYSELRKTSSTLVAMEKQYAILQKERDHTQTELTKAILAKAKLESLCRELQKHNKVIKEENITRVKEEEERRREVATSFTEKLNSLTTLMDENKDKSVRLREENMSMTTKLTELYDQFQERESHLANMNRQMDLQKQLSETQLQKLQVEMANERKLFEQERQALTANLERSEQTNRILEANIASMQDHIEVYKGQYSDFESTMAKSSKVFDAFKAEMANLQKTNAALEQEKNDYRTRWQSCTNSVVQITELHQQAVNDLKVYEKKIPLLERVCRQLQAERSAYQRQLQENNITPVPVAQSQDEQPESPRPSISTPPPTTLSHTAQKKLTKKERMLVALKSELKMMEDQLKKKVTAKERELTTLKSELKLVMEQRKIATKQQEVAKENKEASLKNKEMEETVASQKLEISALEDDVQVQPEKESSSQPKLTPELMHASMHESLSSVEARSSTQPDDDQIEVKFVKSEPIVEQKHACGEPVITASSSSSGESLIANLSLDAIPLYKSDAVMDMTEMEEICLVKECMAVTDLSQPAMNQVGQGDHRSVFSSDEADSDTEADVMKRRSVRTIPLKKVEGKTDLSEGS